MDSTDIAAVKADIAAVKTDVAELKSELKSDIALLSASFDAKLSEMKADIRGWMLTFFVPLWIGVYGTLAAIVLGFTLGR